VGWNGGEWTQWGGVGGGAVVVARFFFMWIRKILSTQLPKLNFWYFGSYFF
jgi:hypothetical protein